LRLGLKVNEHEHAVDENDLIYEGIETEGSIPALHKGQEDENDLIYEGIET